MLEYSNVSLVHQSILRAPLKKQEDKSNVRVDVEGDVSADFKTISSLAYDPILMLILINSITSLIAIIVSIITLIRK